MYLQFNTAQEVLDRAFDLIINMGHDKAGTKYLRNVLIEIFYPMNNTIDLPWRRWSKEYADLEWAWYLSGNREPTMVEERAKLWKTMKDDHGKVWSNYGWWWKISDEFGSTQIDRVIEELNKQPNSRRAIITHYAPPEVYEQYKQDTPCNLILNFYIEHDRLCVTVFARSIDLIFGFCNDQYCFSKLLEMIANNLGTNVGTLTYMITDLHIYEKDFNRKSKL